MMRIHFNLKSFSVLFFALYILNPYSTLGPLGFLLLPFLLVPFLARFSFFKRELLVFPLLLIFISGVGVFSSFLHGIGQFGHLKVAISILVYIFLAYAFFYVFGKRFLFNDVVFFSLIAIVLNSAFKLFSLLFVALRKGFLF